MKLKVRQYISSPGVVFLGSCMLCASVQLQAQGLFRWVDKDGAVHYSDNVPPEFSQDGHSQLSKQGLTLKQVAPAKSTEQVQEEEWLQSLEEKRKERDRQQERADSLLLNSYTSVEELDRFNDERFSTLKTNYRQLVMLRDKLLQERTELGKKLETEDSKAIRKQLEGFLETNRQNLDEYETAISQNRLEEEKLKDEAATMRERYLYLTGRHTAEKNSQDD
ncbi:MAG TPA: DUF4124 domain-containing protein [Thiolinea sp.]|nr:DUF4124 domain-containing protein [Thiolinea sp.]